MSEYLHEGCYLLFFMFPGAAFHLVEKEKDEEERKRRKREGGGGREEEVEEEEEEEKEEKQMKQNLSAGERKKNTRDLVLSLCFASIFLFMCQ